MSRIVPCKPLLEEHEVDESGDVIVLEPKSGQLLVLNGIGAAALTLIDGERDVGGIVDVLCQVFGDVPRADVERDLSTFLDDLAQRKLIELTEVP